MPIGPTAPLLKVNGSPMTSRPDVEALVAVRVDRAFGLVGRATLRFRELNYQISGAGKFKPGTAVEVSIPASDVSKSAVTIFKGEVTGLALEQVSGGAVDLTVTVDEPTYKLAGASQQQTFLQMNYGDIVRKMATSLGLKATVDLPTAVYPYTLVTGTWMSFLDDVTRRSNTRWYYDHTSAALVVDAADLDGGPPQTTVVMNEDLERFSVRTTSLGATSVTVSGWDDKQQKGTNAKSKPARSSRKESDFVTGGPGRGKQGNAVLLLSGTPSTTTDEAQLLADSRFEEGRAAAMTASGTTLGNGKIDLGKKVQVNGAGPASGAYMVTAVEHVYDRRGFRTMFTAGSHRPSGMVDLLDGGATSDSGFVRHQVVIGKVSNNNDPEKLGRVQVKFPTMEGTNVLSTWARTITPDAGKDRGFVFVPEVNDEVLVAFEHGDTRRPIVLGSLFSAKVGLPTKDKANVGKQGVDHRRITSRSGHIIDLDDTQGKEQVLLTHKAGHQFLLGFDKVELTCKNLPITISNGTAKIEMKANGDIAIEGLNIKITAKANLDLDALQVTGKAKTKLALEGGAALEAKSNGMTSVSSSGITEVKGSLVKIN